MTLTPEFLGIMHKLGTEHKTVSKVFRRMLDINLFIAAYTELAKNKGRLTPGIDNVTIDGTSINKLEKLIEKLRNKEFKWTPVKRVFIPKKNSHDKRTLGIPAWEDRVVQMVLKMVLESYYEPIFRQSSHGFRPNKGCHTALHQIRTIWQGTKWYIEGDIKGCFDNIPHETILKLLSERFEDNQLLSLIKGMLEAGYMEKWTLNETYSGTPQGGVVSPLLANIVLHELDKFIEDKLLPTHTRGKNRKTNKEYANLAYRINKLTWQGKTEEAAKLRKTLRTSSYSDAMDNDYRRLRYIRYADDFILGYIGSKEEAEHIKDYIRIWLKQELGLTLNIEKTTITNSLQERAQFLGYEIYNIYGDKAEVRQSAKGLMFKRRTVNGQVQLKVPSKVVDEWISKYSKNGKPIHRNTYLVMSDFEIIHAYGSEWRGLVNYYALANNIHTLREVEWTMLQSLTATLAGKHQTTRTKIRERYETTEEGKKAIVCAIPNPKNPDKPLKAIMGGIPLTIKRNQFDEDVDKLIWKPKYGRTELTSRLIAHKCEICGSTEKVEVHHIRSIKQLKQQFRNKELPEWVETMSARNRNTLVVCFKCHRNIHYGRYDGKKVQ